jgi:rhodanese-related sulfurtransferase
MLCEKKFPNQGSPEQSTVNPCRQFLARTARISAVVGLSLVSTSVLADWPWAPMTWARVDQMIERDFPNVPFITTGNLAEFLKGSELRLVIDVRDSKEFAVSHIEGAVQADSLPKIQALIENNPNAKHVILYCSVGYRSAKYVQQLRKQNRNTVFNLKGSLFAWANESKPLFAGGNKVFKVHPYDSKWGELLKPELRATL